MLGKALKGLERISKAVGIYPDIAQGGGGNTSVKVDHELMLIKASGYRLAQVAADDGFAVVNYRHVIDYLNEADDKEEVAFEKEGTDLIKQNTVHLEDTKLYGHRLKLVFTHPEEICYSYPFSIC